MVPHQLADPLRQDAADYPIERLALSQDRSCLSLDLVSDVVGIWVI